MSLIGVSFADLITAIKLCTKIVELYRNDPVAPVQHLRNEVAFLKEKVSQLDVLNQESQDLLLLSDNLSPPTRDGREQLIGADFIETLKECDKFCARHSSRGWTRMQRLKRGEEVQRRSSQLRERLRCHLQSIDLVTQLVQLKLLREIYAMLSEVESVHQDSIGMQQQIPGALPVISPRISDKFLAAVATNPPKDYLDIKRLPLWETLAAACRFHRLSVTELADAEVDFHPSPSSDRAEHYRAEQYLNLLKACWLLVIIQESRSLQDHNPGRIYKRTLLALQRRIADRHSILRQEASEDSHRGVFSDDELLVLPDAAFNIWPSPPPLPELSNCRPYECELLRFSHPRGPHITEELILFRSSPISLRLVENKVPKNPFRGKQQIQQRMIDTHSDRVVPAYALRFASGNAELSELSIRLTNSTGHTEQEWIFRDLSELFRFQMALTGYSVELTPALSIPMSFGKKRRAFGVTPQEGLGCLQIWVPATPKGPISPSSTMNLYLVYRTFTSYHNDSISQCRRELLYAHDPKR
ncbi:uncharacterized protein BJX67DRAFT_384914 [Aspergillus lucknowensis]|uniref:Fungal N-terminal domain-containing protein n=1 Tax=Aspergillus lucknowensis TaxID=176173 RepID=A0ABR4LF43_9EURO